MSRLGIVAVISRFAVLWTTRAKWDCLDDTCKLTRADSASDEAIVSGYWFKRWNGESDWSGETDWNGGSDWISLLHSCINAGTGGAVAEMMLVWRAAMSRYSAWRSANAAQRRGAVEHRRSEEREECASGRLASAQCAQVGETEHVSQAGVLLIRIYRSRTEACLTSMSDAVCVDNSWKHQWGWSLIAPL